MGKADALAGWLLFDLSRGNDATNAWRPTLKVAKETSDGPLAACTLSYWTYLAASRNDSAPAIRLLQQTREYVPGFRRAKQRNLPARVTKPERYAPLNEH